MSPQDQSASERYRRQADVVMRLAAKAGSQAEKEVYLQIAEGWRKLADDVSRREAPQAAPEPRSFRHDP